ncbi:hypothetical protein B0T16DRAFT_460037 [Cercophora newfieldiana]|uniref:Uncharacterized protein n=1 Tax=Cercophora newfieldiana TaxID=92897 RepID=A0AA39Y304_9PEZI|nr:hypothetical protein B0T16DRAFT_460037 [Cercophora newfieldiana]
MGEGFTKSRVTREVKNIEPTYIAGSQISELPKDVVVCTPGAFGMSRSDHATREEDTLRCCKSPWTEFLDSLEVSGFSQALVRDLRALGVQLSLSDPTKTSAELKAILPDLYQQESPATLMVQLYLLSNNHFEPSGGRLEAKIKAKDERIVALLKQMDPARLRILLSYKNIVAEAIRDAVFASALRMRESALLVDLVATGVDMEAVICTPAMDKRSPLEYASDIQD